MAASERWSEALERFGEGRYYASMEAFDRRARSAAGVERQFCRGWTLLAAALFHRDRGNGRGARACLERAAAHWLGAGPGSEEFDAARTLEAVSEVIEREWARPRLPFVACEPDLEGQEWQEDWNEST